MTSNIDISALISGMKDAASQVLGTDITTLRGFSDGQIKAIALQARLVASGIANGEITEETREFFLDGLEDMALNFVKTLRGLLMVTVEKVWNAVVGVIWKTIESATGITLPSPEH